MHTLADERTIQGYETRIREKGIDDEIIKAYCEASKIILRGREDVEYGLEVSKRAKEIIEEYVLTTTGGTIWELEKYQQEHGNKYEIVDQYYNLLKNESYYLFESYIFYMEKLREQPKRFYLPRRKTLKDVADDLQVLEDNIGRKTFYGLSMPSRVGKLIADDTPVLTTKGWKNHGDLVVGDYVYGLDGKPKKVTYVFPKHYANKRVHFSDHTSIDCHENHEWVLYDRSCQKEVCVETKQIEKRISYKECGRDRGRWYLPLKQIISGSHDDDLKVSPYVLGAWLGDGNNTKPDLTICNTDFAIVEKIEADGYRNTKCYEQVGCKRYAFEGLRMDLQQYGMCKSRQTTIKHIPSEYLVASVKQRLELLAGIIDTDGCLKSEEHRYSISTINERLKDDIVSLISTFGWRVCVSEQEKRTSSSGIVGRNNVYGISFNPTIEIPCVVERKQLKKFSKQRRISIDRIEDIEHKQGNCIEVEGGIYRVGERLTPTHNSTLCIFFLSWIAMKRPNSHNAMGGHSGILAKGFYKELLNLLITNEYTFYELYIYWHPKYKDKPFPTDKSSDEFTITLGSPDRFATITCRGIDGTWTGAVDISRDGYLYVDDLVRDREHSLSPQRMQNTFQEYLNKMVDRKNDGARELMVGTLWNVLDPLQRISVEKEMDERYFFRRIPALDDNDESNFDYEYNGFSTQYYRDMRDRLGNAEWMAKYQQRPYVREGLLFPQNELMYADGIIEDGECVVTALCDPAFGGADRLSMPVKLKNVKSGRQIIIDWVFKRGTQNITVPLIADSIIRNVITELRIEKNSGGGLIADSIKKELDKRNCRHCKIVMYSASTRERKEERIKGYSDYVKDNYFFLLENKYLPTKEEDEISKIQRYRRSEMYDDAMSELHMYTSEGKNPHDDAPDSITAMAKVDERDSNTVEVIKNPFRGGY